MFVSMKNSSDIIGNRTRDLPVFRAVTDDRVLSLMIDKNKNVLYIMWPANSFCLHLILVPKDSSLLTCRLTDWQYQLRTSMEYDMRRIWKEVTKNEEGKNRQKRQDWSAVGRKRSRYVTVHNKIATLPWRLLVDKGKCNVGASTHWEGRAQNTSRKVQICVA